MDLIENQFYLLGATVRDNKAKLSDLAESLSLLADSDSDHDPYSEARAILTHPRKRLSAEVSWLPGVGTKKTSELIYLLEGPAENLFQNEGISPIIRANLLASFILKNDSLSPDSIIDAILHLANSFEEIDPAKLLSVINEDRSISGFPHISDHSFLEEELNNRRQYFRSVCWDLIANESIEELANTMTLLVDKATLDGAKQSTTLLYDVVDYYEIHAQKYLAEKRDEVTSLIKKVESRADEGASESALNDLVSNLGKVTRDWDVVAQPIQVSTKSRGLGHEQSEDIAFEIRGLLIKLNNEFGLTDIATGLTDVLQEVFAEVDKVADRADQDASALAQVKADNEAHRREITYEVEIGAIFKDHFKISPDGIYWKGNHWRLDEIVAYNQGGISSSTHTDYHISWRSQRKNGKLLTRKKSSLRKYH